MIWVTAEDVVAIHSRIIQVSGGIDGLRDRAGLEAAIAAPLQSFGGEDLFPTDIEKIARIGFGLASNHAFIDGNKRIGAMVTQLLLKWNYQPNICIPYNLDIVLLLFCVMLSPCIFVLFILPSDFALGQKRITDQLI